MTPAVLLRMNLGKQMLAVVRSSAYLWRNRFIMRLMAVESFVMNVKRVYSNSVESTDKLINLRAIYRSAIRVPQK